MNRTNDHKTRKIWIVASHGDTVRELEAEFVPTASISDLIDALAYELAPAVESAWVLTSDRLQRELSPTDPILGSGLVSGDRVELRSEARAAVVPTTPRGAVDLVVVGGALLGARHRLELGRHLVGRGSGSDVKLDDPSLSRRHFEVTVTADDVLVSDAGSTNGTFIDGERLTGARSVAPSDVVEVGGSLVSFEPALSLTTSSATEGVEIPFNRPPRIRPAQRELAVEAPAPPDDATRPRVPLAMAIVPLVIGIALVLLFPENKAMLLFFAMTPIIAVWSFVEERRSGSRSFRMRRDEYLTEVARLEERLAAFVEDELHARRDTFPDASELTTRVRALSPRLWERRPEDTDFLAIRVGWGDEPSAASIAQPQTGSRQLRDEIAQRLSRFTTLRAVPIVVSLREAGTTGLCGEPDDVIALARWAVVQLATQHSPEELEIAAILSPGDAEDWDWLKWLPHAGAMGARGRIVFEGEALNLIERLVPSSDARTRPQATRTLVIVNGAVNVPRSALGRLLRATAGSGLSVLWIGRDPRELPGECRAVVEVDTGTDKLLVLHPEQGRTVEHSGPEGISDDHARSIAHALAPIRDAGLGPKERSVPTRVGLWETLDVAVPSAAAVRHRWAAAAEDRTVPVGVTGAGPLRLDLRRDGPHALIGGTTGAGKSELLQSLVVAMAFGYPPDRVNLLLIDYKGGTAFEPLAGLPHVVGSVTDLDGHLARRTLTSLEAELRRREVVLREHNARDVVELESKNGARLPDLLLVVDEFAALVADLPGFVDGMVDIAQRGRALGLHLILATQKPAGVVSEKIRANTNLRVALRMSDEADSTDVIGIPDSAYIPRTIPGRGFVRLGHGEVTEFQSPFASAPAITSHAAVVVVRRLGPAGVVTDDPEPRTSEARPTQLQSLVAAISEAGTTYEDPFSPVLPPLPHVLPLAGVGDPSGPGRFPIGMVDDPAAQRQRPFELDFERDGSALVFGAGGSGKTTLLRTIAASMATHATTEQVQIYVLDLGTRDLGVLEALPHCGSAIFADEEERIRRLFAMLRDEIAERRAGSGAGKPQVVVLLDGYAGFAAAFERVDFGEMVDALPRLVADGRQVGIHFVITADRRGAVPAALTGIIGTKIVLRLADDDEYTAFGLRSDDAREALATRGRAFAGPGTLMQSAVAGAGASITEQTEAIQEIASKTADQPGAPPVRTLSATIDVAQLPAPGRARLIPIGRDERLDVVEVDLTEGHLLIAGPRRAGRSTTLASLAMQIERGRRDPTMHLLSPRGRALPADIGWTSEMLGSAACEEWIRTSRETLASEDGATVFIDDGDELFDVSAADALQGTLKWARDNEIRFVVAVETHATHRAFGGWIAELRKEKQGLLLEPDVEVDGDLLAVRLPRRKQVFPPGRGYLVVRGVSHLIQVARPDGTRGNDAGSGPAPRP